MGQVVPAAMAALEVREVLSNCRGAVEMDLRGLLGNLVRMASPGRPRLKIFVSSRGPTGIF